MMVWKICFLFQGLYFEVPCESSRNPVPRNGSVETSGPSEPIKHRNLRNLFHATFWTGTLEPQNLSEPIETRIRFPERGCFPEPPQLAQNTPKSILRKDPITFEKYSLVSNLASLTSANPWDLQMHIPLKPPPFSSQKKLTNIPWTLYSLEDTSQALPFCKKKRPPKKTKNGDEFVFSSLYSTLESTTTFLFCRSIKVGTTKGSKPPPTS